MPGQWQTQFFGITGFLALCFASHHVAVVQSEDCSDLKVERGVYSGVYSYVATFESGGDVYRTETDDDNYAFLALISTSTRRRLEDARHDLEESLHETDGNQHKDLALEEFVFPRASLENARAHAADTLAACDTSAWINWKTSRSTLEDITSEDIIYPTYQVDDCAEHPTDITETWVTFPCRGCDGSYAPSLSISCDTSSGSSLSGGIIAGIVIGVLLVIAAAIGGGIWCCIASKRRGSHAPPTQVVSQPGQVVYANKGTSATQQTVSDGPSVPVNAVQTQTRPPPPPFEYATNGR